MIYMKFQKINLIDLLKRMVKGILINGVKLTIAYKVSILLLGYCVLTPLFVRLFNLTQKNKNVAECWALFELPQQQPTFSGLTWDQVILSGIVCGVTIFALNKCANYLTENILPPFWRSLGYDYYTQNEKVNMVLEQNRLAAMVIDQQSRTIEALQDNISTIDENIKTLHGYLTHNTPGSLLHKIRFEFTGTNVLINETRNTILDMQRGQLRLIQEKLMLLERSLGNVSSMTADLASRPIPNFREDLAEITTLFRDFQNNILRTISEPINILRAQVHALETFEPNELHTVTDRLRQTLGAFEHLASQVQVAGANIEAAIQNSAERIEEYEGQVIPHEPTTTVSRVSSNGDAPNNVPSESLVGGLETARQNLDNESSAYNIGRNVQTVTTMHSRASGNPSQEVTTYFNRPASGNYFIEQRGDEIIIRLSLRGVNVPVTEMTANGTLTPIRRAAQGALSEAAVNGLVSLATTYGPKIA